MTQDLSSRAVCHFQLDYFALFGMLPVVLQALAALLLLGTVKLSLAQVILQGQVLYLFFRPMFLANHIACEA